MGYIVSCDCSILVTVSRENAKNVTVKRAEKTMFIVSEHFSADSKIYHYNTKLFTVKIPTFLPFTDFQTTSPHLDPPKSINNKLPIISIPLEMILNRVYIFF